MDDGRAGSGCVGGGGSGGGGIGVNLYCEIITSAYFDFCMYCLEFTTIKTRRVSEDGVTAELYNTLFNSIRTWLSRIRVFAGQ